MPEKMIIIISAIFLLTCSFQPPLQTSVWYGSSPYG